MSKPAETPVLPMRKSASETPAAEALVAQEAEDPNQTPVAYDNIDEEPELTEVQEHNLDIMFSALKVRLQQRQRAARAKATAQTEKPKSSIRGVI